MPSGKRNLYLLDEPTTGLHAEDVRALVRVLHELVEQRHSVLVIEHNLDLIAQADWVIDLGPGGGRHGGKIVAEGTPAQVARHAASRTGQYLAAKFAGQAVE
jgi:excinuclease ABC subunit A